MKNQIEIVNHQVVDDTDISRSERKRTDSFRFDVFGIIAEFFCCQSRGVKTLDVSDLQNQILRFRLFDIDIIIRRTLQYTLLTGLLVFVYFGLVIILQNIYASFSSQQSPIIIVISTLVIAALFNPLRIRIQDFIDRRFYRKKYNAEKALADFASTARDEVEMDKLTAALLDVMEQTLQPETTVLLLKNIERSTSGER